MDRLLDKAMLLAGCMMLAAPLQPVSGHDGALVCGMLLAVTASCACETSRGRRNGRMAASVADAAFFALAAAFPDFCVFGPIAVYDLAYEADALAAGDKWWNRETRREWAPVACACLLAAAAYAAFLPAVNVESGMLAAVCAGAAALLAMRTGRAAESKRVQLAAHDAMRKAMIELEARKAGTDTAADGGSEGAPKRKSVHEAVFADERLTERECLIVEMVAQGADNRTIAKAIYISEGTVRNHISVILSKLGLKNRTQVAAHYWQTIIP